MPDDPRAGPGRSPPEHRSSHGSSALTGRDAPDALATDDELPVVARMVVEIRSDGSRTIARGAAEDGATGEKVAIRIEGSTPLALALSMMKTMSAIPSLARTALKALRRGND